MATAAYAVGGLLMIWSAYIHFHLYDTVGYRSIHIIGPLFLLQAIAGLVLGIAVIAARRVWAAFIGAGFAVSTLVGFLISVQHGLFNFKESWSAPFAHQAFAIEIATIVVFIIAGALSLAGSAPTSTTVTTPAGTST
jgi:sorbitol-specific phosphotransferase system component IIBC